VSEKSGELQAFGAAIVIINDYDDEWLISCRVLLSLINRREQTI
jgi:hypothetical protein